MLRTCGSGDEQQLGFDYCFAEFAVPFVLAADGDRRRRDKRRACLLLVNFLANVVVFIYFICVLSKRNMLTKRLKKRIHGHYNKSLTTSVLCCLYLAVITTPFNAGCRERRGLLHRDLSSKMKMIQRDESPDSGFTT